MMWRWKRANQTERVEAMQAGEHADRQLQNATAKHAEALSLAETLRQIRERNHFGQSLENLNWSKQ